MAGEEVKATLHTLRELKAKGSIACLTKARTPHDCKKCPLPIEPGEEYYCVYLGGAGLGNLKFPDRYHKRCLEANEGGK